MWGGEPVEQDAQWLVVGPAAGGEGVVGAVGLGHHGLVGEMRGEQGVQDAADELLGGLGPLEPGEQVRPAAVGVGDLGEVSPEARTLVSSCWTAGCR